MRTFAPDKKEQQNPIASKQAQSGTTTTELYDRAAPMLSFRGAIGNQAAQRILRTAARGRVIQTKLTINKPGDEFEREADSIADQVMRMPDSQPPHSCTCGGECARCQRALADHGHEHLQTRSEGA